MTGKKIKIDYDNVDVADIMQQLQAQKATPSEPALDSETKPDSGSGAETSSMPQPEYAPIPISRSRRVLLKIMRPFAPLIKLLILPVHQDLMQTIHTLDHTNQRLDHLNSQMEIALEKLTQDVSTSRDNLSERLDSIKERLDRDLVKTMEYTKLLHSLSHNLVVELSKLKIEEEGLKVKTRIMEKDFEHLSHREKALEKHIFK